MRIVILGILIVCGGVASADPLTRVGVGTSIGGGVEGFTDDRLAETAGTGAAWNLRVTVGTRLPFALEAAYDGSAQTVTARQLDRTALLISTGLEAGVRFNLRAGGLVSPYVATGVGWRRYDLPGFAADANGMADHDDVLELPVGVGLAFRLGGTTLDARAQYRFASGSDLARDGAMAMGDDHLDLNRWGVSANLGVEL